jgi:long-chain acyl-CoA synthetase
VSAIKIENLFCLSKYIDKICVVGDGRKFVTALVVPNFDAFIEYFQEQGIAYNESALQYADSDAGRTCIKVGPDFVAHRDLRAIIDAEIREANNQLEDFETIEKYHILNRKFTATANEVTPTLKLKRKVIQKYFSVEIDKLYD